VQVVERGHRFGDPAMGHELYCAGHLFQAAVADARTALGPAALGPVAERFALMLTEVLRGEQATLVEGHPEVETALVELYRTGRDNRFLELALDMLGRRGRKTLSWHGFGPSYFQDDVPFEQARSVRGHAVRCLYLLAGATDLYTETGKADLWSSILSQWEDMTTSKTYLTGGVGSRHQDEAFGDPFELPPDRAYCERCAAIASIMWNWRLVLLTGEARFAELMERTLYNGFLAGIGLDGTSFFYVNPLQARQPMLRSPWNYCACCPPNGMRLMASLEHYLATTSDRGVQLHQYASGRVLAELGARGSLDLAVETDYPFDELVLELPMAPRLVRASDDVDSVRGCVAYERGPLVYCFEGSDVPGRRRLEGVSVVGRNTPVEAPGVDIRGHSVVGLKLEGVARADLTPAKWPYYDTVAGYDGDGGSAHSDRSDGDSATQVELRAVPYFAWANRGGTDMRVWVPEHP
jgi:DUF1680 family protein